MIQCPKCGIQVMELQTLSAEMMQKLQDADKGDVPPEVCDGCVNDLRRALAAVSSGVLMAQERNKEQYRLQLWKSRVALIKKARQSMTNKVYADAAVTYEKYLKILDIVFEVNPGEQLKPEAFKDSARTTELTVLASVYWDLLRIYDTNSRYADRMFNTAKQLALFIQYTPIYPDIIRKAEDFQKKAKNPQVIRQFLKMADKERPRCFIATAAFEDGNAFEVLQLRDFRDLTLRKHRWGRKFILLYYKHSPRLACLLDKQPLLKPAVRAILRLLIKCVT